MIGKFETNKDLVQELTASGARHVGNIASIIAGTVGDVTREIGEWVTDAIEMNEAAATARRDASDSVVTDATHDSSDAVDEHAFPSTAAPSRSDHAWATADEDNGATSASIVDAEVLRVDDTDRDPDKG